MKMNKGALIVALLLVSHVCHAAVTPAASRFDPRNQIVSYNPQNTTDKQCGWLYNHTGI